MFKRRFCIIVVGLAEVLLLAACGKENSAPTQQAATSGDSPVNEVAKVEEDIPSGRLFNCHINHSFCDHEHDWDLEFYDSQSMSIYDLQYNVKHEIITPENVSEYYQIVHQKLTMTALDGSGYSTMEGDIILPREDKIYIDRFSHSYEPYLSVTGTNFHSELQRYPDGSVEIISNETVPYENAFTFFDSINGPPEVSSVICEETGGPEKITENELTSMEITGGYSIFSYLPAEAFHWIPIEDGFSYLPFDNGEESIVAIIIRNESLTDIPELSTVSLEYIRDGKPYRPVSYTYYNMLDEYGLSKSSVGYPERLEYETLSAPLSVISYNHLNNAVIDQMIWPGTVLDSDVEGCIYCGEIFTHADVKSFDVYGYPYCPYCNSDRIINADNMIEINKENLNNLKKVLYPE